MKINYIRLFYISLLCLIYFPCSGQDIRAQFDNFTSDDGLNQGTVYAIAQDKKGFMWFGTGVGLNRFDGYEFKKFPQSKNRISCLYISRDGKLWVGGRLGRFSEFDYRTESFIKHPLMSPDSLIKSASDVMSIGEDAEGNLWLATVGDGLFRFNPVTGQFTVYRYDEKDIGSIRSNKVSVIYVDSKERLWIGTRDAGFSRFDNKTEIFTHFQHDHNNHTSLSHNKVTTIYEDSEHRLWIGTHGGGLNLLDESNNTFIHYRVNSDRNADVDWIDRIGSVTPYDDDNLWLGTYDESVDLLNKKTGVVRNARYVQRKNNSNINTYDRKHLLARRVYTVLTDSKKRNWLATSKGLYVIDVKTMMFKEVNYPQINFSILSTLLEDVNGDLWIGTYGDGLFHVKHQTGSIFQYSQQQGLCDVTVYSLSEDNQGNIWIGTNKCLAMLDVKSLIFSIYDKNDGLQENEFNSRASLKLPSGELVFSGINGFNIFNPDNIKTDKRLPRVSLTEFIVFNQPVAISASAKERELMSDNLVYLLDKSISYTDEIVMDYPFKMFGFSFSALNYKNSLSMQYQYKLEPWDENWIPISATKRIAQYSNLPTGEYVFNVKAGNKNGYWNEQPTSIKVIILPPPWKTWWAKMSYVLCIIGLILIAIRVQKNKIKFKNRELERERKGLEMEKQVTKRLVEINMLQDEFLSNTSHELRTPLNGIIGIAESVMDGAAGEVNQEVDKNLSMIVSSGKRLANLVNDILDFSKLKNHELELKIANVELYSIANIVMNLSIVLVADKSLRMINTIIPGQFVVKADENRLQQIFHNLIGNAIKFTESGEVRLSAEQIDEWIIIRVTDTGIGIPENKLETVFDSFQQVESNSAREFNGTGLGLSVCKKLVELHGGKIYVESSSTQGTVFTFTLKARDLREFNDVISIKEDEQYEKSIATCAEKKLINMHENVASSDSSKINDQGKSVDDTSADGRFKILIVDDEPINRKVLQNHLKGKNYHVQEVKNGFDALQLIDEQADFDMILLDIMMPKMSGYDVCKRIREKYSVSDLPIIFLTAKYLDEDKAHGFSVGGNDYIAKPISKLELISRVKTHFKLLDINRNLERIVEARTVDLKEKNHQIIITQKRMFEQEKLAALGTITGGLAHEINNPVGYLYFTSRHLEKDLNKFKDFVFTLVDDDSDQDVRDSFNEYFTPLFKHTEILDEGTERLRRIVTDLRSFSHVDNSELIVMSLSKNIKTTMNLVKTRYEDQVTITLEVIDDVAIRCWPTRLNQVFMNIMINACQAMVPHSVSETGNNEISKSELVRKSGPEANCIEILVYREEESAIVEIRDNGCGMSKTVLDQLFDPFFTTKKVSEGTSLGLSVVQDIVHKHDGSIEVQSELGRGTMFTLTFPLANDQP